MTDDKKYENDGWPEYQKLIMYRLDELKENQERHTLEIFTRLVSLEKCVASMRAVVRLKGGLWGAAGGVGSILTALAAWAMFIK